MDTFKVENNFQFTKDEVKGTLPGFCFTVVYAAMLTYYAYNRLHLFWTHDEDSYSTYDLVNMFEDGPVDFKETLFTKGVFLNSSIPKYEKVLQDEDQISQYVNIYSAEVTYDA
jgi:hypothetical protein